MSTTDQAETRPAWWRCTASSDRRFTVGVAYEVQEYRPDGRAIIVTDMERTLATLPVEDATFVPHDPWNQRNRPTITPADQAETLEATAKRNLRHFIKGAAFKCEVDRDAALNCLDVLEAALNRPTITPADEGLVERVAVIRCKLAEVLNYLSLPVRSGDVEIAKTHLREAHTLIAALSSLRSTPPAAGEEGDRALEVGRIAAKLEEWDMKPAPDECTGHSYMDIAADILASLTEYRLATRSADVAELRAALEPFARFGAMWLGSPTEVILRGVDRSELTIADLRRARAALTGQPVTKGEGT